MQLRRKRFDRRDEVRTVEKGRIELAVHAAARILALAQPGDILVSGTVRDLLADSGLEFEDRGAFELRGIDGRRPLAALIR